MLHILYVTENNAQRTPLAVKEGNYRSPTSACALSNSQTRSKPNVLEKSMKSASSPVHS